MSVLFNVACLLFGLIALLIPIIALFRLPKRADLFSCLSLSASLLSLYCQLCEYHHRVQIQDWSALLDASDFIQKAAFVLMIMTLALNLVLFLLHKQKA